MGLLGFFGKKKLTPEQIQQIRRQEKILADSLRIIQSTDNLETFFARYKTAEDTIKLIAIIAGDNTKCIAKGQATPAECIESLYKEKEVQLNNCLARYIKKETVHIMGLSRGRLNKANGIKAIIEEFESDMPKNSYDLGIELADKMIKKIEKLEK